MSCYNCGELGHRALDCQLNHNSSPIQPMQAIQPAQQPLQSAQTAQPVVSQLGQATSQLRQAASQPGHLSQATCVEIYEDESTAGTDLVGVMMMTANLVEVINKEKESTMIERVKGGIFTIEDAVYMAAMAEKRGRGEIDDSLVKGAPSQRRLRI